MEYLRLGLGFIFGGVENWIFLYFVAAFLTLFLRCGEARGTQLVAVCVLFQAIKAYRLLAIGAGADAVVAVLLTTGIAVIQVIR